jgi:hypothetical protein
LEVGLVFYSAHSDRSEDVPRTSNNWVLCGFQEKRILPTRDAIRASCCGHIFDSHEYLKLWLDKVGGQGELAGGGTHGI